MNKINYNDLFVKETQKISNAKIKPKLLMHACCAPCSTECLRRVIPYFDVDLYFYNPNITCSEEFDKRLIELQKFTEKVYQNAVKIIVEDYNSSEFLNFIKGYEKEKEGGNRCKLCYELRLEKTAILAKELNYDYFTTTLSVSPYKNATWLNEIGGVLQGKYSVNYLFSDFKKENGYKNSIKLSNDYDLYRQNYCGCLFSKNKSI